MKNWIQPAKVLWIQCITLKRRSGEASQKAWQRSGRASKKANMARGLARWSGSRVGPYQHYFVHILCFIMRRLNKFALTGAGTHGRNNLARCFDEGQKVMLTHQIEDFCRKTWWWCSCRQWYSTSQMENHVFFSWAARARARSVMLLLWKKLRTKTNIALSAFLSPRSAARRGFFFTKPQQRRGTALVLRVVTTY